MLEAEKDSDETDVVQTLSEVKQQDLQASVKQQALEQLPTDASTNSAAEDSSGSKQDAAAMDAFSDKLAALEAQLVDAAQLKTHRREWEVVAMQLAE